MSVEIGDYLSTQRGAVGVVDKNTTSDVLAAGQNNLTSSYETFLSLLTAQLKNQDPTSPMDTNAFTQQLVQMTGVQQQLLSNQLLKQIVTQGENGNVSDSLGMIGRTATAIGDKAALTDGKASWSYELDKTASKATLTVSDANGRVMWTGDAPDLGKGEHAFVWDGKGINDGTSGETYTLSVSAKDANGSDVGVTTYIHGPVTAVRQTSAGTVAEIGGVRTPVTSVISVQG